MNEKRRNGKNGIDQRTQNEWISIGTGLDDAKQENITIICSGLKYLCIWQKGHRDSKT